MRLFQPLEIFVDDETKLTLHGLQQHYVKLEEIGKNRKLNELLDTLEFNQVKYCLPLWALFLIVLPPLPHRLSFSSSQLLVQSSLTNSSSLAISRASASTLVFSKRNGAYILISLRLPVDALSSINRYTAFKAFEKRILVATDIFGRG